MLEKEFQYYLDHQNELANKFDGKYIVIVDNNVIGSYDTELEAYEDAIQEYEPGTFLIQKVSASEDSYTEIFHSRVAF